MNVSALKKLLQDTQAHPVPLHYALKQYYGPEYTDFAPTAINEIIYWSFGIQINSFVEEKLNAARVAENNDLPVTDYFVFEKTVNAFTEIQPNFGLIQGVHYYQLLPAIDSLSALIPRSGPTLKISIKVANYIEAVFLHDHMICVPQEFNFLQNSIIKHTSTTLSDLEAIKKAYENIKAKQPKDIFFSENPIDIQVQKCYNTDKVREEYINRFKKNTSELELDIVLPAYKLEVTDVI